VADIAIDDNDVDDDVDSGHRCTEAFIFLLIRTAAAAAARVSSRPISATLLHHFVPETLTAAGQWSNAV